MRGFLRSSEALLSLAPKITTIGREACDITIQANSVDKQHALLEFCEEDNCYVLQDLNSGSGTYVNDTRVQNAAVRLAPFDQIRFGFGGNAYQFELDDPSMTQRSWNPQIGSSITRNPYHPQEESGLPQIPVFQASSIPPRVHPQTTGPLPHQGHTSLRSRPLSAGAQRDQVQAPIAIRGSWVGGSGAPPTPSPNTDLLHMQQEKEQKALRMGEEINRLQAIQQDNERKTVRITQLVQELTELRQQLLDNSPAEAIKQLEAQLHASKTQVTQLHDEITKLKKFKKAPSQETVSIKEFNDKLQELHTVKAELERVKKDKNIISGLVNQTQRDMSTKDTSISRLTRELEQLKKDVRNRDVQLATLQSKVARVKAAGESEEQNGARDKELVGLRYPQPPPVDLSQYVHKEQFKNAEAKTQELNDTLKTMKAEIERKTNQQAEATAEQLRLTSEVQHFKAEFLDMQRSERATRVDLEQASRKGERFRNRVIQVAFSTPGVKYPDDDISDEDLMDALKKVIDERTSMQKQITELKDQIRHTSSEEKKGEKALKSLRKNLVESQSRLKTNGLLTGELTQEISVFQAISVVGTPEVIQNLRQSLIDNLQIVYNWEKEIEDALDKSGIDPKLLSASNGPAHHIVELFSRYSALTKEKDGATTSIKMLEANHRAELATQSANIKQEMMDKITEARDRARQEGETHLQAEISRVKQELSEKHEAELELERQKQEELEASINTLKSSFLDQTEAGKEKIEAANEALRKAEEQRRAEDSLREEIERLARENEECLTAQRADFDTRMAEKDQDMETYKEQIRQHAVTIVSLEQKVSKAQAKSKTLQQDNSSLKQQTQELQKKMSARPKPSPAPEPPKARVIIEKAPQPETLALQQTIATLRQECLQLKKLNGEQQNVILALKKDLAGAEARLGDTAGEIPEGHKRDLENQRDLVRQKSQQVLELQQKLSKLSDIVDSKTLSTKQADIDINTMRSRLDKMERELNSKNDTIRSLEMKILDTNEVHSEQARQVDDDNKIKTELSTLGLACRGDRHQLVIERQREALSELRRRIKELEGLRGAVGATKVGNAADAALKQVDLLKRELVEMRAGNLADEHSRQDLSQMAAVERAVNKARGINSATDTENVHERTAHQDTQQALEQSENSYLSLLRGVASCLELHEVAGLKSLAHMPLDERLRLADEREEAADVLTQKIKALKERLMRKDDLLRNYERDLSKLRQAELLVAKRSEQVEALVTDVQQRLDETMCLRATLDRTKDRLHTERRLNDSIKKKKTFHLENEKGPFVTNRRHACPPDDLLAKEAAIKKKQIEKIRRKNYEIKTLKEELGTKHSELCHTTTRLANLENDMNEHLNEDSRRSGEVLA